MARNQETNIQNEIRLTCAKAGATTFRNVTAQGWAGKVVDQGVGYVTIANPRPLVAGLCVGSSDVIGWHPVTITPGMVGKTIAVFVGLEIKTPVGKASTEQLRFSSAITKAGGIAGFPTDTESALALIRDFVQRMES